MGLEEDEGYHESSQPANLAQPEIQITTVPTHKFYITHKHWNYLCPDYVAT